MNAFRRDAVWRECAREMRSRGLSYRQIARILGVKYGAVRYAVNEIFREDNKRRAIIAYHNKKLKAAE